MTIGKATPLFVIFFTLLLACSEKREDKLLIIGDDDTLGPGLVEFARGSGLSVDTVSGFEDRRKDQLLSYGFVALLAAPGQVPVEWQTDIERYVQSGGVLLLRTATVNKFHWPWLYEYDGDCEMYDGGSVCVMADSPSAIRKQLGELAGRDRSIHRDRIRTLPAPEPNRFSRIILDDDVNEPMELAVLPNHRVIYIEREGKLKLYDPETDHTKVLHTFEVSTEGNYEDGMLGLTVDPDYEHNNWIYLCYSPAGNIPKQHVSRFRLAYSDSLILASEKVILEIPVQRKTCCHSAGSLVFGPEGNLYISTGDNTSSKESDGYAPLDERPGRGPFDAQKSSSNTHDLRGKILRIKPTSGGSYTIPDGNLFPKDGSEGRPEIYVMGCRNPFRFTVDRKTGYVYWGDVGPDSGEDSELGPRSYDEWNQARKPGFFGWPYFVADNKAYPMLDFATGEIGPPQDPEAPVNTSPNNTGSRNLPPAQPAMIWYPYAGSDIWPMLGKGSRSAMAGPVYYRPPGRPSGKSDVALPAYYNGKLFIYDWARSWIKVLSFDEQHNLKKIEPFLTGEDMSKPIDMETGPDGALYVLEYGANYFADNMDARLVRIEYHDGNRMPVPEAKASKVQGAVPLEVEFSAGGSFDYDQGDRLSYQWVFGDEAGTEASGSTASFVYRKPGVYHPVLIVKDAHGGSARTELTIRAGNEPPAISFRYDGNQSFYFGKETYAYEVVVTDKEDGSTANGAIAAGEVKLRFNYIPQGYDMALLGQDFFEKPVLNIKGKALIETSDCRSCHADNERSIGPSYMEVANRYRGDKEALSYLAKKVIQGGNGNWGEKLMAAHPQHTEEEAREMVKYILAFGAAPPDDYTLRGQLTTDRHGESRGRYVLSIRYQDHGANGIGSITTTKNIVLRPPRVEAENYDAFEDVQQQRPMGGDMAYISNINDGSYLVYRNIDLKSIKTIVVKLKSYKGGRISVRMQGPGGEEVGKLEVAPGTFDQEKNLFPEWEEHAIRLDSRDQVTDLCFVFGHKDARYLMEVDWFEFKK